MVLLLCTSLCLAQNSGNSRNRHCFKYLVSIRPLQKDIRDRLLAPESSFFLWPHLISVGLTISNSPSRFIGSGCSSQLFRSHPITIANSCPSRKLGNPFIFSRNVSRCILFPFISRAWHSLILSRCARVKRACLVRLWQNHDLEPDLDKKRRGCAGMSKTNVKVERGDATGDHHSLHSFAKSRNAVE